MTFGFKASAVSAFLDLAECDGRGTNFLMTFAIPTRRQLRKKLRGTPSSDADLFGSYRVKRDSCPFLAPKDTALPQLPNTSASGTNRP